ncbi:hypothetical protein Bca52824_044092 [Brassica carinata]|uniref:Hyccin n=1 Tax=Brassica carinata TaxID=52824 RepID=A0A8X7S1A9_BRACI|nr:hypothetical protein Bca52824_044092 [Brassica carinata]
MSDSPPPPTTAGDSQTTTAANESESNAKCQTAIQSLSSIVTTTNIPPRSPSSSKTPPSPPRSRLSSSAPTQARETTTSAAGSTTPSSPRSLLHLLVLRFVPLIAGLYLSRVPLRQPQAGFEAVLLALYAHETTSRAGQAVTVNIPDLSHPSIYHESSKGPSKTTPRVSTSPSSPQRSIHTVTIRVDINLYSTVRSTRRARIVGVALELYYSEISRMPRESKLDFCEACEKWAGAVMISEEEESVVGARSERDGGGRIPLPWELVQPMMRILGHCLMGTKVEDREVTEAASRACQSLYLRALHDINPKAILAAGSLLRLREMGLDPKNRIDHTELSNDNVLSV